MKILKKPVAVFVLAMLALGVSGWLALQGEWLFETVYSSLTDHLEYLGFAAIAAAFALSFLLALLTTDWKIPFVDAAGLCTGFSVGLLAGVATMWFVLARIPESRFRLEAGFSGLFAGAAQALIQYAALAASVSKARTARFAVTWFAATIVPYLVITWGAATLDSVLLLLFGLPVVGLASGAAMLTIFARRARMEATASTRSNAAVGGSI